MGGSAQDDQESLAAQAFYAICVQLESDMYAGTFLFYHSSKLPDGFVRLDSPVFPVDFDVIEEMRKHNAETGCANMFRLSKTDQCLVGTTQWKH